MTQQTTNRQYWIEDGTGRGEARHWTDQSVEHDDDDAIEYVDLAPVPALGQ